MRCAECVAWKPYNSGKSGECTHWDNCDDKRMEVCGWDWSHIATAADFGCVAFKPHTDNTGGKKITSANMARLSLRDLLNEWPEQSDMTNAESNAIYKFVEYVEQQQP